MSAPIKCPKCGDDNSSLSKYCQNCGNALLSTTGREANVPLQIPVYAGKFPTQSLDIDLARLEPEQSKSLNRSRRGLWLVFIGILVQPIPRFAIYGGLAIIAGAIFVFLGRRSLDVNHQRFVSRSIVLLIVGQVAAFVSAFVTGVLFASSVASGTTDVAGALSVFFLTLYAIVIVTDAITSLGLVYLPYGLQDSKGRTLLWLAFSLEILIDVVVAFIVVLDVQASSQQILSQASSIGNAIVTLQNSFAILRLLLWIPAIPYAIAYYKGWSRIDRKAVVEAKARSGRSQT